MNTSQIDFPKDKLVDLLYENFSMEFIDMSTLAYRGRLSIYLYRSYKSSYQELLTATDAVLNWLHAFNNSFITIGDNTEVLATVGVVDGTFDDVTRFRVVSLSVPFEVRAG